MALALLMWTFVAIRGRIKKGTGGHWEHWYRLHHLAKANRMLQIAAWFVNSTNNRGFIAPRYTHG